MSKPEYVKWINIRTIQLWSENEFSWFFWHSYLLKLLNKCTMENDEEKYPEPPELKEQHIPPLKKVIRYIVIAIAVAFVIVLIFSLIFWWRNR